MDRNRFDLADVLLPRSLSRVIGSIVPERRNFGSVFASREKFQQRLTGHENEMSAANVSVQRAPLEQHSPLIRVYWSANISRDEYSLSPRFYLLPLFLYEAKSEEKVDDRITWDREHVKTWKFATVDNSGWGNGKRERIATGISMQLVHRPSS